MTSVPFAPTGDMFFKEVSLLGNTPFLPKHVGGVSSVSQSASVAIVRDAPAVLADLGLYGSQSTGGVHFKERLHPPFSDKASAHLGTFDSEGLCDFRQAEPFAGVGSVSPTKQAIK